MYRGDLVLYRDGLFLWPGCFGRGPAPKNLARWVKDVGSRVLGVGLRVHLDEERDRAEAELEEGEVPGVG